MLALPYEIWRDIPGYEGYYQVSNLGRIKTLDRYVKHWRGGLLLRKSQLLKLNYDADGYIIVGLSKNGKTLTNKVHRLVAQVFIPNPNNLPVVNHKDENKSNNCVWNIEWCTVDYNNKYGDRLYNVSIHRINNPLICKPVLQYTLNMEFVAEYPSAAEAERQTGIKHTCISSCCRGIYKQTNGYIWIFKSESQIP